MKKYSRGLIARYKMTGQIILSLIVGIIIINYPHMDQNATSISIPFIANGILDIGWLYLPLSVLVITGTSNAVNLTDGLDGMATGFVISNVERRVFPKNKEKSVIKYNNFTRDTSLQKFPPVTRPQCISEKKLIVHPPLTFVQKIVTTLFLWIVGCIISHILFFAPQREREWFIGWFIGRIIEDILNDDD